MSTAAGEPPQNRFVLGFPGWWLETTREERDTFTGMLYLTLYHVITVSTSLYVVIFHQNKLSLIF